MDKSMLKGAAIGGIAMVVLGAGAAVGLKAVNKPAYADVVAVRDVTETVVTPQERCDDVVVSHQAPVQDQNRIAGSLMGGIAGGLLGGTLGGGTGKTVATVAGAAAGGYAGNQMQKNMQQRDSVSSTEHRCRTVNTKSQRVVGYDVTYQLNGRQAQVRTSFRPGPTLAVKDGQVVTTPPANAATS